MPELRFSDEEFEALVLRCLDGAADPAEAELLRGELSREDRRAVFVALSRARGELREALAPQTARPAQPAPRTALRHVGRSRSSAWPSLAAAALVAIALVAVFLAARPSPPPQQARRTPPVPREVSQQPVAPPVEPPRPALERETPPAPLPPPQPKPAPAPTPLPEPPRVTPAPPPSELPKPVPAPRTETIVAIARLERVEGSVFLGDRIPAADGADLLPGHRIETSGRNALAAVRFPDGTRMELEGNARVGGVSDSGGKRVELHFGRLFADVKKQPAERPFVVATPHGEAKVVGTRLRIVVEPGEKGSTRLEVAEGRVILTRTSDRKSVEVTAGQFAVAAEGRELVTRAIDAFTLKDIPSQGLALWLRADAGATVNGAGVSVWADQSGNRRDAAQTDAARQPALVPDVLGGRPVLRFDGENDQLIVTVPVEGLGGLTLVLVAANSSDRTGGPTHGEDAALFWPETTGWGWVYLSPFQSNVKMRFGTTQPDNLPFHIRSESLANRFSLTISIKDGSTDSLFVQGVPVVRETKKLLTIKGTQPELRIGGGHGKGFPGDIAEILVYTRALSDADRQRLERALFLKYFGQSGPKR